jgi:hypothetical protein
VSLIDISQKAPTLFAVAPYGELISGSKINVTHHTGDGKRAVSKALFRYNCRHAQ